MGFRTQGITRKVFILSLIRKDVSSYRGQAEASQTPPFSVTTPVSDMTGGCSL